MSALYSLALEKLGSQRGYVVAGSLHIGDKRVFGEDKKFDGKKLFSESNLDWDGDAWVVYGYWLTDVSSGIRYVPQYVLTQDQVDAVGRGALSMIGKLNGIR